MFKIRTIICFILFSLVFFPFKCHLQAAPLNTRGAILMNLDTVKVIYEQNSKKKIPPASLSKIMTMYLVFDAIKKKEITLDTKVKISKNAANTEGSSMGLVAGESVTVKKLLLGMAVASGNDACVAIAEKLAKTEKKFVSLMNKKAKSLKMNNTVFKNSSGLPAKGQYTTATDMLALSRNYIMVHPKALRYHSVKTITHRGVVKKNKNPQLGKYKGADGLKTGWTRDSGYNIVSTSRRGKVRLIAIILGAKTSNIRAKELNRLMDAGFKAEIEDKKNVYNILGVK